MSGLKPRLGGERCHSGGADGDGGSMALRAQITGAITEPVLRFTPKQQSVLDFRINATAAVRNKATGQWEDLGSPLWVSVAFWEHEAQTLNETLDKGDRVTVEGTLVQETYKRRDGAEGTSLSLRWPKFLGVVPSRRPTQGQPPAAAAPASDPWATDAPSGGAPF